jgi:hypothetical protein
MLLEKEQRDVESVGIQQVARATIKTSPKIFNFFADQTYANKPRAICRELVANAFDSHVMAGKGEVPVEVWLPTILEPTFKVRDQGLGMNHSFMMNEFMCYADGSTKDGSNVAIGGFGIGSKSPFAYVDQYTVRSVFDGIESIYSIFKDEEGIPAIGLLGQRTTNEPNGVEVSFPVKPDDFSTFEQAAFESLKYFEPLPDIKNATEGSFIPPAYVSRGKVWGMRPSSGPLQIIMGGVMYPVNVDNLTYKFPSESPARALLKYGLDLRVPIGTCSVALSREALSYDDKTVEAIRVACEAVIDEVAASFSTMFDDYDSGWEARVALHREVGGSYRDARASFLAEHAKWRGQPLKTRLEFPELGTRQSYDNKTYPCWGYSYWTVDGRDARASRRAKDGIKAIGAARFEYPDKFGLEPAHYQFFIIDDLPQKPSSRTSQRIKLFLDGVESNSIVIRPDEDQTIAPADIIKAFGDPDPSRVVLTSELPEPIVERIKLDTGKVRPKVRMFTYDGHTWAWKHGSEERNLNPGVYGLRGVEEVPYELQPETGILVVMENFKYPLFVQQAVKAGLIDWDELHFANVGDAKKLKGWTRAEHEIEQRKKAALAKYPELAQRLALFHDADLSDFYQFFRRNPDIDFTSRKPFGQIFKLYKYYVETLDDEQMKLAIYVTPKLPRGVKPDELVEKFKTKQWRARILFNALGQHTALEDQRLELFLENL